MSVYLASDGAKLQSVCSVCNGAGGCALCKCSKKSFQIAPFKMCCQVSTIYYQIFSHTINIIHFTFLVRFQFWFSNMKGRMVCDKVDFLHCYCFLTPSSSAVFQVHFCSVCFKCGLVTIHSQFLNIYLQANFHAWVLQDDVFNLWCVFYLLCWWVNEIYISVCACVC